MPIRPENKDRYPKDWSLISDRIRFHRAAYRCECAGECRGGHVGRCVLMHGEVNPDTGKFVWLTVAHLDHTPENCDDANLKAMCQGCHLRYDVDHHAETRRATLAAERASWMTPLFAADQEDDAPWPVS
jgi:hypothetical protein